MRWCSSAARHIAREKGDLAGCPSISSVFRRSRGLSLQFELDQIIGYPSAATGDQATDDQAATEPWGPDLPGIEILRELGRGASGIVYLARQVSIDRLVAVKAIALSATDAESLAPPRQEATILSRMQTSPRCSDSRRD